MVRSGPATNDPKIGAIYIQIVAFRDWVVGDSYGQISAAWGKVAEFDG